MPGQVDDVGDAALRGGDVAVELGEVVAVAAEHAAGGGGAGLRRGLVDVALVGGVADQQRVRGVGAVEDVGEEVLADQVELGRRGQRLRRLAHEARRVGGVGARRGQRAVRADQAHRVAVELGDEDVRRDEVADHPRGDARAVVGDGRAPRVLVGVEALAGLGRAGLPAGQPARAPVQRGVLGALGGGERVAARGQVDDQLQLRRLVEAQVVVRVRAGAALGRGQDPAAAPEGVAQLGQAQARTAVLLHRADGLGGAHRLLQRGDLGALGQHRAQPAAAHQAPREARVELLAVLVGRVRRQVAEHVGDALLREGAQAAARQGRDQRVLGLGELRRDRREVARRQRLLARHALGEHHQVRAAQVRSGHDAAAQLQRGGGEVLRRGGGEQRRQRGEQLVAGAVQQRGVDAQRPGRGVEQRRARGGVDAGQAQARSVGGLPPDRAAALLEAFEPLESGPRGGRRRGGGGRFLAGGGRRSGVGGGGVRREREGGERGQRQDQGGGAQLTRVHGDSTVPARVGTPIVSRAPSAGCRRPRVPRVRLRVARLGTVVPGAAGGPPGRPPLGCRILRGPRNAPSQDPPPRPGTRPPPPATPRR